MRHSLIPYKVIHNLVKRMLFCRHINASSWNTCDCPKLQIHDTSLHHPDTHVTVPATDPWHLNASSWNTCECPKLQIHDTSLDHPDTHVTIPSYRSMTSQCIIVKHMWVSQATDPWHLNASSWNTCDCPKLWTSTTIHCIVKHMWLSQATDIYNSLHRETHVTVPSYWHLQHLTAPLWNTHNCPKLWTSMTLHWTIVKHVNVPRYRHPWHDSSLKCIYIINRCSLWFVVLLYFN